MPAIRPEPEYQAVQESYIPAASFYSVNMPGIGGTTYPIDILWNDLDELIKGEKWDELAKRVAALQVEAYTETVANLAVNQKLIDGKFGIHAESYGALAALKFYAKAALSNGKIPKPNAIMLTVPATEPITAWDLVIGMATQPTDTSDGAPQNVLNFPRMSPHIHKPSEAPWGEALLHLEGISAAVPTLLSSPEMVITDEEIEIINKAVDNNELSLIVFGGGRDTVVKPAMIDRFKQRILSSDNVVYHEFTDGTHSSHGDHFFQVWRNIAQFLVKQKVLNPNQVDLDYRSPLERDKNKTRF